MSNSTSAHSDADTLINEELYKINEWLEINKLSLNVTKSKFVVFHMPKKEKFKTPIPKINNNNIIITKIDDFTVLGLTLDTQLNWKKHSENISNKYSRIIGTLNRLKLLPVRIKIMLYNTLLV